MTVTRLRALVLAPLAALGLLAGPAAAQTWPDRPLRIIVPYPAGGATDLTARTFAQHMAKPLGQQVIVENRAGAAGAIGMEAGANAAPDGYTLLLGTASTFAVNPQLYKQTRYDPLTSYAPVCLAAAAPVIMLANASLPAKTFKEVVAWSHANPGKLNYATDGQASLPHLGGEYLKKLTGIDMTHVPYKGSASATAAVLSGQTQLAITGVANAIEFVRQGELRLIANAGPQRLALFPDAPTMAEAGVPGFDLSSWFAFVMPAGTDPAIVNRLGQLCREAAADPQVAKSLAAAALEVRSSTPQELDALIKADYKRWGEIIETAGVKVE